MIMLTGGSGVLGAELQKHMGFYAPSHDELDITKEIKLGVRPNLIVHCAAYTDLVKAERDKDECSKTNVLGTRNLVALKIPMIYISTEYVFDGDTGNYSESSFPNPVNFYALTKFLGEREVARTKSTIIRCLFKPRPFKHSRACVDQFTSGDYVDKIALEIIQAIKMVDVLPNIIHIGSARKSTYELAIKSRVVKPISIADIKQVKLPKDTSLDCSLWNKLKERDS